MYLSSKQYCGTKCLCLIKSTYRAGKHPLKTVVKCFMPMDSIPDVLKTILANKEDKARLARMLEAVDKSQMEGLLQEVIARGTVMPEGDDDLEEEVQGFNSWPVLKYGHLAAWPVWNKILGLKYRIDYLQNKTTGVTAWQLNDLLFYLAAAKMLCPESYLEASSSKSDYFYCPWAQISQDNFYRGLDFMYEHREDILAHAVRSRLKASSTSIRVAFFDCTNTWFETPYDDLTWQIIRFRRAVIERESKAGKSDPEIEAYLNSEDFEKELQAGLELSKDDIIRMRGPSKEGRYAQPLVGVALAIDQTGYPIDCKVFAGNMSELKMVEPMLESLAAKYGCKDVYFTADRGLNSVESIDKIKRAGLGFVVAQKVMRQKKEVAEQMLDLNGYRSFRFEGDDISVLDEEVTKDCSRFKICDYERCSYVENTDGAVTAKGRPRRHKVTIKCRIIFTFSSERQDRDLAELNYEISKANQAVADGKLMGNKYSNGWRSLVETAKEHAEKKEDKEMYRAVGIKQDVIAERRKAAGYHAVIFDHPENCSKDNMLNDNEILSAYHRLVRIEDCFRVMKSNLSIRPMYVRSKQRIVAHCYLCVLSLMMLRYLQDMLEASGSKLSIRQITRALGDASVLLYGPGTYEDTRYMNILGHELMHAPLYTGKRRAQQPLNEIENQDKIWETYEKERKSRADNLSLIMQAVGLKPLKAGGTLADAKRSLNLNSISNDKVVARVKMKYMEACNRQN